MFIRISFWCNVSKSGTLPFLDILLVWKYDLVIGYSRSVYRKPILIVIAVSFFITRLNIFIINSSNRNELVFKMMILQCNGFYRKDIEGAIEKSTLFLFLIKKRPSLNCKRQRRRIVLHYIHNMENSFSKMFSRHSIRTFFSTVTKISKLL